jgi:HEAT repeat protein
MDSTMESDVRRMATSLSLSRKAIKEFRQPLVEYLVSGLEDNDKWVRVLAAEMLGVTGDPRSARYLEPFLTALDNDLRLVAARSLAMLHSPQSAFIQPAVSCEHCMIRLVADEALVKLKKEQVIARRL